mmetsp:Transcript_77468/g.171528  ORF Transcript_77468/g.171528 Transcript_77468/m.171528 type:complete len:381 (+) Transcript_77468:260-1402(+)
MHSRRRRSRCHAGFHARAFPRSSPKPSPSTSRHPTLTLCSRRRSSSQQRCWERQRALRALRRRSSCCSCRRCHRPHHRLRRRQHPSCSSRHCGLRSCRRSWRQLCWGRSSVGALAANRRCSTTCRGRRPHRCHPRSLPRSRRRCTHPPRRLCMHPPRRQCTQPPCRQCTHPPCRPRCQPNWSCSVSVATASTPHPLRLAPALLRWRRHRRHPHNRPRCRRSCCETARARSSWHPMRLLGRWRQQPGPRQSSSCRRRHWAGTHQRASEDRGWHEMVMFLRIWSRKALRRRPLQMRVACVSHLACARHRARPVTDLHSMAPGNAALALGSGRPVVARTDPSVVIAISVPRVRSRLGRRQSSPSCAWALPLPRTSTSRTPPPH